MMSSRRSTLFHRGFTMTETLVSLGVLAALMLAVAQLGYLVLSERLRLAARQEALETAANTLEAAQALPWDELTPAWARQQRLPESLASRLHDGRLTVQVAPEPGRPHARRTTVTVQWRLDDGKPVQPVQLVAVRSARSTLAKGDKP